MVAVNNQGLRDIAATPAIAVGHLAEQPPFDEVRVGRDFVNCADGTPGDSRGVKLVGPLAAWRGGDGLADARNQFDFPSGSLRAFQISYVLDRKSVV